MIAKARRTIKISDFVKAIELNGYMQSIGRMITYDAEGNILSACAFGQAALNLGVSPVGLELAINQAFPFGPYLAIYVTSRNDRDGLRCEEIAARIRDEYPEILDKKITIENTWEKDYGNYQGVKV